MKERVWHTYNDKILFDVFMTSFLLILVFLKIENTDIFILWTKNCILKVWCMNLSLSKTIINVSNKYRILQIFIYIKIYNIPNLRLYLLKWANDAVKLYNQSC